MKDLNLPDSLATTAGQGPQVLQHLMTQHLELQYPPGSPGEIELLFDEPGSLGILFEASTDRAPITGTLLGSDPLPAVQAPQCPLNTTY